MDGQFDILFFIVGSMLFFVLPFAAIISIINFFISRRMAKTGQIKSKYYWPKLIGFSVLILIAGLYMYDAYYKLAA